MELKLLLALVRFVAMSIDGHSSWVALIKTILIIHNRRAFSCVNELFGIRVFFFEVVRSMYFLYYLFILILHFLNLFFQIFKLLVQVRYLLSSPRIPLVIHSGRRSQIGLIANWVKLIAFSKSLAHLKWILLLIGNFINSSNPKQRT